MLQWIPAILYAALIFYISSQPYIGIPPEIMMIDPESFMLHIIEYLPLGFLAARAVSKTSGLTAFHPILFPVMLGSTYGISDELHQVFVPGRTPSILDAMADTIGVIIGAYVWSLWTQWRLDTNFKKRKP